MIWGQLVVTKNLLKTQEPSERAKDGSGIVEMPIRLMLKRFEQTRQAIRAFAV